MIAGILLVRADRLPKVPAFSHFSEAPIFFLLLVQDGRFVRSRQASFDVSSCIALVINMYALCMYSVCVNGVNDTLYSVNK